MGNRDLILTLHMEIKIYAGIQSIDFTSNFYDAQASAFILKNQNTSSLKQFGIKFRT